MSQQDVETINPGSKHFLKTYHVLAVMVQILEELPKIVYLVFVTSLPKDFETAVGEHPAKEYRRQLILDANGISDGEFVFRKKHEERLSPESRVWRADGVWHMKKTRGAQLQARNSAGLKNGLQ